VRDGGERVAERLEHGLGKTVAALRPVEREHGDALDVFA